MSNQTRITIRKLKIAKFASEETLCFEAEVLFDGKPVAKAHNMGQGGCTYFHALHSVRSTDLQAAEDYAKTLPDEVTNWDDPQNPGQKFKVKMDLEHVVDGLVYAESNRRDRLAHYKRSLRTKLVYINNGEVWTSRPNAKISVTDPRFLELIQKRYPGAVILNTMPLEAGFELWNKHVQESA